MLNLKGSVPALITPMLANGDIDYSALEKLLELHVSAGSQGLVLCGTTGEAPTLLWEEKEKLLAFCQRIIAGRIPLIAGCSSNSTAEACLLTQLAVDCGMDATLHATGYYNKPSQAQLIKHYEVINNSSAIPLLVYNIPSRTGVEISPDSIVTLSEMEKIIGVKDSTGDTGRLSQERNRIKGEFLFFSGDDSSVLGYMAAGGDGCISVTANAFPVRMAEFIACCLSGDFAKARQQHESMIDLHKGLFIEPSPGGIKYLMSLMGLCENQTRLPITPVSPAAQQLIEKVAYPLLN